MASLKDIAESTGVSIRTVSRALKNNGYVKHEVREKILKAAAEMNYRPNRIAQSLRSRKSYEITLLLHSTDELHMAKMFSFENHIREAGYRVSVIMNMDSSLEQDALHDEILDRRPAGAAFFSGRNIQSHAFADFLKNNAIPYISFEDETSNIDSVTIDRPKGVYEAVMHLNKTGRKNICYLGNGKATAHHNLTRLSGFERAISELNLECRTISTEETYDTFYNGKKAAETFHAVQPTPDAILAYSDLLALGFLAGLHEKKIPVPQQIALIGFDNRRASALSWPRLTTVSQPNREVGEAAARILLAKINNEPPPPGGWSVQLPTSLVVRETT